MSINREAFGINRRCSTRRLRYVYCLDALKPVILHRTAIQSGSRAYNSGTCSAARREILVSLPSAVTEGVSMVTAECRHSAMQ
jgi:hypothetical protein